ncbi:MAG: hypothetical protein PHC61_15000, partial [Chitinivibrionales bacterium]|nr:hypothetical protein [Chitinivibrionales bacterium]
MNDYFSGMPANGAARKKKTAAAKITLLVFFMAFFFKTIHAESIYLLPVKSTADVATTDVFASALTTFLSQHFTVVPVDPKLNLSLDSNVCTAELGANNDSLVFSVSLYLRKRRNFGIGPLSATRSDFSERAILTMLRAKMQQDVYKQLFLCNLHIVGTDKAKVYLNKELSGRLPFNGFLLPGPCTIKATTGRFLSETIAVTLTGGKDTTVSFDLVGPAKSMRLTFLGGGLAFAGWAGYLQYKNRNGAGRTACWTLAGLFFAGAAAISFDIP